MSQRYPLISILLVLALVAAACSGGGDDDGGGSASGDAPIAVSLEVDGGSHAEGDAIEVTVHLKNVSATAVTVLRPYLLPSPVIFVVTNEDGVEHGYQGVFGERRPATADRFIELGPGESSEQTFDLTDGYRLPAGKYEVIASYRNADDGADHGLSAFLTGDIDYSSAPVTIEVK
jgi:hypothetical protein